MVHTPSSIVQAQPAQVVTTQTIALQSVLRKEATTKILLFISIVTCLVLAVNI